MGEGGNFCSDHLVSDLCSGIVKTYDMSEYSKLLKRMQWKYIAGEVRKRDGYKCVKCGSSRSLHVHHKVYVYGRMPWEYNEKYLETLCKECHSKEHECKKSFTTKDKNVARDSKPRNIGEKKKKKNPFKIKISKDLTDKRKRLESQGKIPTQPLFETKLRSGRNI